MSEAKDSQQPEDSQDPSSHEVVEVKWDTAKDTYEIRQELVQTKKYLTEILLDHERRKLSLLERLSALENAMYESATSIQQEMSLNPEWTYEFKLPLKEGDSAYFIRKQD